MLIRLDMASATPIYVQLRNQIVMGIGTGALKVGEKLPTVRQMAADRKPPVWIRGRTVHDVWDTRL